MMLGRHKILFLALVVAVVLPRLVALWGVEVVESNDFNDMPVHLANASKMHGMNCLSSDHPFLQQNPEQIELVGTTKWPHGVYHVAQPWIHLFGPLSIWTTQATNLLFTLVLLAAVFVIGAAVGGTRVGMWGTLLVAICPPILASTWYFSLDYPLVAMVTAGLFLLWKTEGFSQRGRVLLFAAWSCLGLFVKWSYALYLLAPSLWNLAGGLRNVRPWRQMVINLVISVAGTLGGIALLQGLDRAILGELAFHLLEPGPANEIGEKRTAVEELLAVPVFMLENLSVTLVLISLPGLALLHLRGSWAQDAGAEPCAEMSSPRALGGILRAMVWGTVVIFTLMTNKLERYVHPLYPVLFLLIPWAVRLKVPRRWQTPAMLWITTAVCATSWLYFHNPNPWSWGVFSPGSRQDAYEFKMPHRQMLSRLRGFSEHRGANGPLIRAMVDLARLSPRTTPLGIGFIRNDTRAVERSVHTLRMSPSGVVLLASQYIRDRLIYFHDLSLNTPLPPMVIIFHVEGEQIVTPHQLELVSRRRVMLDDHRRPVVLSLVRPRGQPTHHPSTTHHPSGCDNNLYMLDAVSGKLIWKRNLGGVMLSSPCVVRGTVYIGTCSGMFYALGPA